MDVSGACIALLLLAGPAPVGAPRTAVPDRAAVAPSYPVSITLSSLHLPKVRVRTPEGSYVLRRPSFDPDGIAWRHADGFPRGPRPLLSPGWDTVPPPPNPLPWSRVEALERSIARSHHGAVVGGVAGALLGGGGGAFLGWASALSGDGSWGSMIATTVIGAATGGITLGLIGHALFDPPERWEALEWDRAGAAGLRDARR